jgi:excisionase family DNA binding protein
MAHNDKSGPNESPPLPRLSYKINEAAKILGVSPITVRRAISRGLLKPCRAFRHPLIPAEQLRKLIARDDDKLSDGGQRAP